MDGDVVINTFSDPWMYVAVILIGLVSFGIRAIIKGDLRSSKEIDQAHIRVEKLEQALRTRDDQVDAALRVLPDVQEVLEAFHKAGREGRT